MKRKGAETMPSIAERRVLRKKFKRRYLCFNRKHASTQTIGSAFLERVRKRQNSKNEPDLLKIFDSFVDGYGFVNSDLVSFSMKSLKTSDNLSFFKCLRNY